LKELNGVASNPRRTMERRTQKASILFHAPAAATGKNGRLLLSRIFWPAACSAHLTG
jgi:hypothetical protein